MATTSHSPGRMPAMRIAVVQLGYDDDEPFGARVERVAALVADQAGHDLVVLPELWGATGFDYTRWAGEAQPLDGPWARAMADAARAASVTLHAGSFVERLPEPGADGNDLANTSLLLDAAGNRLAVYRKIHRFGFGAGEPRLMEAGGEVVVTEIPSGTADRAGGAVDVLRPAVSRAVPSAGRGGGGDVRRAGGLAGGPGGPLDPARAGPGGREPVRRRAVQHRRHARGLRDGRAQPGGDRSGEVLAEAPGSQQQVLSVDVDLTATTAYRESSRSSTTAASERLPW